MIGEKCNCCGDEVLILKELDGRRLCLDCFYEYRDGKTFSSENVIRESDKNQATGEPSVLQTKHHSDRRCPNCGRIIPFDSVLCPYCGKKFESFL